VGLEIPCRCLRRLSIEALLDLKYSNRRCVRYEDKHDGHEGVSLNPRAKIDRVDMSDDILEEVRGIPKSIGLPYCQISKRMGRPIPHLTFVDQSSYNLKVRDPRSNKPYLHRFDNIDLRWPMFGDKSEIAFLKGCADTSGMHGMYPRTHHELLT
jgi:hypothetical protein